MKYSFSLHTTLAYAKSRARSLGALAVLAGFLLLAACTPSTTIEWSEEVKLHDGRTIIVSRSEGLGPRVSASLPGSPTLYYHFCYAPMRVEWKSKPEYFPETFDIVDGKAYAKVTIANCITCMLHGYPETDALYFTWENEAWKKIDFNTYPRGLRYNMLSNSHLGNDESKDVHGLVTLAEKVKRDPTIYFLMERIGITGLNEMPGYKGACEQCKGTRVSNPISSEIFLPIEESECK